MKKTYADECLEYIALREASCDENQVPRTRLLDYTDELAHRLKSAIKMLRACGCQEVGWDVDALEAMRREQRR